MLEMLPNILGEIEDGKWLHAWRKNRQNTFIVEKVSLHNQMPQFCTGHDAHITYYYAAILIGRITDLARQSVSPSRIAMAPNSKAKRPK